MDSCGYIQGLIDNASDGDTIYIPSEIYFENIIINKPIHLIGEKKETTIINGSGGGDVIYVTSSLVKVNGFTIKNGGNHGIQLVSDFITISDNIISMNNKSGIYIWRFHHNNNFSGNIISMNNWGGVYIRSSDNIIVENLNITNTDSGIQLRKTYHSIIRYNNLSDNYNGIDFDDSSGNTITGNTILNNKNGIFCDNSELNMISGNFITKNEYGIYLFYYCNNNTISGNNFIYSFFNAFFIGHCNKYMEAKLLESTTITT